MAEALLGCPHCAKAVGFAAAMAGQVVACPHCRGQFQMPDKPPMSAPPMKKQSPPAGDVGLAFDGDQVPAGREVRAELDSYRAAATLANIFALVGFPGMLCALSLFALLVFPSRSAGPLIYDVTWLILIALAIPPAAAAIVGLFLARACVLVMVDAARTLRALERDAAVSPKAR